jgi:hypothetical protein
MTLVSFYLRLDVPKYTYCNVIEKQTEQQSTSSNCNVGFTELRYVLQSKSCKLRLVYGLFYSSVSK